MMNRGWRGLLIGACAAFAMALFGGPSAWASAACTALQGSYGPSHALTGIFRGTGFRAGEVITLTLIANPGTLMVVWNRNTLQAVFFSPPGLGTSTYTFPTDTTDQYEIAMSGSLDTTTNFTWSCAPGAPPTNNTDSQKLASLQQRVTPLIANTSGQAITGSIDGAINDAFGNGGVPFSGGASGFAINFAAVPGSTGDAAAHDAVAALAFAGDRKPAMPGKAPPLSPTFDREWSLWADARGTGWTGSDSSAGFSGRQLNITAGLGRKITPNWLIGFVGGYETFNCDVSSLTGTLKGNGGTVGGYTAYKILPSLRWDAALTWSRVAYDARAGTASGSFTGDRWIVSTGLTGNARIAVFIVEPSAKLFALWEKQGGYTDSLGTVQASHDFSAGRVSAGGKVIYPWQLNNGWSLSPYAGLYGDWRFGNTTTSSGEAVIGLSNGWSARLTGGVGIAHRAGGVLAFGGEYGGLGTDSKVWTANARASLPF